MPKRKSNKLPASYELTPQELPAMASHLTKIDARKPSPSLKISPEGDARAILFDHPDQGVAAALRWEQWMSTSLPA